jgi:transglycosylase-like protein with SLT domain
VADIFVGSVAVGVVPDARGWNTELRRQLVPSADSIGREYGSTMGRKISESMGKAGEQSAGAFGDTFRKRLDAALKALPKAKLDGDSTAVDRKLEQLRLKMEEISKQEIIDPKKALKDLAVIQLELDKISSKSKDIRVTFNTKEARAQLALLQRDVGSTARAGGILSRIPGAGILANIPGLGGIFGGGAQAAGPAVGAAGSAASAGGGLLANPYVLGGGAAALAAAAPFAGQAAGGLGILGLGGGLAAMGIAGAFGLGTSPAASQAQLATATQAVTNAQLREQAAQHSLNKLQASGKATALQLAQAHASLATAQNGVVTSQGKLTALQKTNLDATTKGQLAVRKAFTDLKTNAIADLTKIGVAFIPVMEDIAGTATKVLKKMTPVFSTVMEVIRGPFDVFVNTILKAFTSPAVVKSIEAVAVAFANILIAFTPDIAGIFNSVANSITQIANEIAAHPKAFADFLNFIFQIGIFALRAIAVLTQIAIWIESHWNMVKWVAFPVIVAVMLVIQHWSRLQHETAVIFDRIRHDIAHYWDLIFQDTIGRVIRTHQWIQNQLRTLEHNIASTYDRIRHDIASAWDLVWNNTIGRATRGWHDLMGIFSRLKADIVNWFHDAIHWLSSAGSNIVTGLLNGIKSGMANIGNWVNNNIVQPVLKWVKNHFGISSPSAVMVPIGRNIVAGMLKGIFSSAHNIAGFIGKAFGGWPQALGAFVSKSLINIAKLPEKALKALGSVAGKVGGFFAHLLGFGGGGGVSQWAGIVAQALALLGLPISLTSQVLYQMQTESGGNPNAINLTDINAQMGDPSRGLLQVIGSTFAAYHVPGTSSNIYDPLANVAAALNYARHVYGPSLMRGGMGLGSGHGYDEGGWLPPGITIAQNLTGSSELVLTQAQLRGLTGGASGVAYHAHFDGLTGAAIESHVQVAFTAMSLTQGHLNRQGRRS